jgi:hypothetical protein
VAYNSVKLPLVAALLVVFIPMLQFFLLNGAFKNLLTGHLFVNAIMWAALSALLRQVW